MPTRLSLLLLLTACGIKPTGDPVDVPMTGTSSTTDYTPTSTAAGESTSITTALATSSTTIGPASTTVDSTTTTSSTTAEMTFIPTPDLPPGAVPCNPLDEMPCPEGQKCSVASAEIPNEVLFAGQPACFPILGDKQKGESCDLGEDPVDGLDDCGAGTLCFATPFGWGETGICVEICGTGFLGEPDQSCADPNDFCFLAFCQDCPLSLCLPTCDPLAPSCPNGQVCAYAWSGVEEGFMCTPPNPGYPGVGESCDGFYACAHDGWCVLADELAAPCADSQTCCTPLCDLDAPNTCPGAAMGEVCQPFFPEPFDPQDDPWGIQYNDLGYCTLP